MAQNNLENWRADIAEKVGGLVANMEHAMSLLEEGKQWMQRWDKGCANCQGRFDDRIKKIEVELVADDRAAGAVQQYRHDDNETGTRIAEEAQAKWQKAQVYVAIGIAILGAQILMEILKKWIGF